MRRTHSPGGATTAEFFVGVIFRVSIRKTCYNFEMEEFLASFCVARVCQRQLGFLFLSVVNDVVLYVHTCTNCYSCSRSTAHSTRGHNYSCT